MSALVWVLFAITVGLDVWGQTAFKFGLTSIESAGLERPFWLSVALSPWIIAGFLSYAVEACCWMYVVGHAPLSAVGPMAALSYVGAVAAGRLFLGERPSARRWTGAGLITLGACLLAVSLG
jgi:undecaprenyl phosphate-alpha-L-ara4N flippase subunit ArnE